MSKSYSDYSDEELSKMDAYTIASLIVEERKIYGKQPTLEDNIKEYEKKHQII